MLGCATKTNNVVPNECGEGRSRCSSKEGPRENTYTTSSLGSTPRKTGDPSSSLPGCPSPQIMIADIEGFLIDEQFFIKELALYDPFAMVHWVGTFQQPFSLASMKKKVIDSVNSQQFTLHGMDWESGQYPYSYLPQTLWTFASNYQLYAENKKKCEIIQEFSNCTVIDLACIDIPPLYELPFGAYCYFHDATRCSCALDRAVRIGHYFLNVFAKQ